MTWEQGPKLIVGVTVALVLLAVGCRQEPVAPVEAVPLLEQNAAILDGYSPTVSQLPRPGGTSVKVEVYRDPEGCQYLVFYEQYHGEPAAVVVRSHAGSNGVCMSGREP